MASNFIADFSPLGDLYNTYQQSRQKANRERVLGQLGQGGGALDYGAAARALLASGDTEGGLSLARLAEAASRDQRDFALHERQASPAYIRDVARTRAEVESEFAPKTTNIKTATGDEITVEKGPNGYRIPKVEGAPTEPNNPFMSGGAMNEAQSKDALYASRMMQSEKVFRALDAGVATNPYDKMRGWASDKIGYNLRSPEYQKFDQARRDFINATLRRESGAVISEAEFANANQQYFPQPGDTPEVIAQKRANRIEAIKGIGAGAGKGYRPESKFDPAGEIVPNAPQRAAPAGAKPITKAEYDSLPSGATYTAPDGSQRTKR